MSQLITVTYYSIANFIRSKYCFLIPSEFLQISQYQIQYTTSQPSEADGQPKVSGLWNVFFLKGNSLILPPEFLNRFVSYCHTFIFLHPVLAQVGNFLYDVKLCWNLIGRLIVCYMAWTEFTLLPGRIECLHITCWQSLPRTPLILSFQQRIDNWKCAEGHNDSVTWRFFFFFAFSHVVLIVN